jgi:hypothetical protein
LASIRQAASQYSFSSWWSVVFGCISFITTPNCLVVWLQKKN